MANSSLPISHKDVVDEFKCDKRLGRAVLLADDAAFVNILLNALITPPNQISVLWNGSTIISTAARDEIIEGEELFLCHKWKDEEGKDRKEDGLFHCFSSF